MNLQDLDLLGFPHLEGRWIGGNVDLDHLSLFPQRYARIMGGIERGASFPRSTMVGEREKNVLGKSLGTFGEESPLNRFPQKLAVLQFLLSCPVVPDGVR